MLLRIDNGTYYELVHEFGYPAVGFLDFISMFGYIGHTSWEIVVVIGSYDGDLILEITVLFVGQTSAM